MYNLKANSTGPERWIAKLLLNYLYGIFGRKQETLKTGVMGEGKLDNYICAHIVKNIIRIENNRSIVLMVDNVSADLVATLNSVIDNFNMKPTIGKVIKSNVAIASAITS